MLFSSRSPAHPASPGNIPGGFAFAKAHQDLMVFEAQAHGHPEGSMVRMTCYTAAFEGELLAASEIEKLDFFPYSRKAESSPVDHLIFDDLREKGLIR